jgi:ABC-type nitrate/sulfonate/bicarbonate transport system permease component
VRGLDTSAIYSDSQSKTLAAQNPIRLLFRRRVVTIVRLSRLEKFLWGAAGLVLSVGAWQLLSSMGVLDTLTYSSPWDVLTSAKRLYVSHRLLPALGSTGFLFAFSMAISIGIGIPVGIALGWYRRLSALMDRSLSIFYAMPRIALIPVVLAYAGLGSESRIIIVCMVAIPPILINTAAGVATIDRNHLRLARSYLATNLDLLRTVALPGSIPTVIAGVRQGMLIGLLGAVVAEYFVGTTGIGGVIFLAGQNLLNGEALVGALLLGLAAIILTAALRMVEKRLDKWRT